MLKVCGCSGVDVFTGNNTCTLGQHTRLPPQTKQDHGLLRCVVLFWRQIQVDILQIYFSFSFSILLKMQSKHKILRSILQSWLQLTFFALDLLLSEGVLRVLQNRVKAHWFFGALVGSQGFSVVSCFAKSALRMAKDHCQWPNWIRNSRPVSFCFPANLIGQMCLYVCFVGF